MDRRTGRWWAAYALSAAVLPLAHPLAVSALVAHAAALGATRDPARLRPAAPALAAGAAAAAALTGWAAADRADAPDGTGGITLARLAAGVWHGAGGNPVLLGLAAAGLAGLAAGRWPGDRVWKTTLVAGLVAAPVLTVALTAVALPVYPHRALVLCAPGLALAAAAAVAWAPRELVWAGSAIAAGSGIALVAAWYARPAAEDWPAIVAIVRSERGSRETVVVVPERSRAALRYYAPYAPLRLQARGDGAWVAVRAGNETTALGLARSVVRTPTYALLETRSAGSDLRLQHWVRP